jgi:rubredoxin
MKHQLEKNKDGYVCKVCTWAWKTQPVSSCPGLPRYGYGALPEHLQTFTHLKTKGLQPLDRNKPVACVGTQREWIWFYDEREAVPRRKETAEQKAARKAAWLKVQDRYRCPECHKGPRNLSDIKNYRAGGHLCVQCAETAAFIAEQEDLEEMVKEDWRAARAWAYDLLQRDDWCLLDLETTDLNGYTDEELSTAPTLPEVWPDFLKALEYRSIIVTYNADFDKSILKGDLARYQLLRRKWQWACLMERYSEYVGEYSEYHGDYRWQPLPGGNHRALGDAQAALDLLTAMARQYTPESEPTNNLETQESEG